MIKLRGWAVWFVIFLICITVSAFAGDDSPWPDIPTDGPGGTDYLYNYVGDGGLPTSFGEGEQTCLIYEPSRSPRRLAPVDKRLPVIAFLHGFQFDPANLLPYEAFIHHLVKKGYIVVYPLYNAPLVDVDTYEENAAEAIKLAIEEELVNTPRKNLMGEIQFAMVAHSFGGVIAANLAVQWYHDDYPGNLIPRPRAMMLMDTTAGVNWQVNKEWLTRGMDPALNLAVVLGEEDTLAGNCDVNGVNYNYKEGDCPTEETDSGTIFLSTDFKRKIWILLKTAVYDDEVTMVANHQAPCTIDFDRPGSDSHFNSMDYYGYWKWTTSLMNLTFNMFRRSGDICWGLKEIADMGVWADGRPVTPAEISLDTPFWRN